MKLIQLDGADHLFSHFSAEDRQIAIGELFNEQVLAGTGIPCFRQLWYAASGTALVRFVRDPPLVRRLVERKGLTGRR